MKKLSVILTLVIMSIASFSSPAQVIISDEGGTTTFTTFDEKKKFLSKIDCKPKPTWVCVITINME